ncbi:MAG: class I mannose-6-phosphate isomerase, partial [Phycisphaerae bacterium]|nr:class I mannose-6-phosphate isomerase [Phycisphaerae bacterium]
MSPARPRRHRADPAQHARTTMHVYPYRFHPIYKERLWGGRNLQRLFGRQLPPGKKIGESWDLVDLPGDSSVLANGPDAGVTLHELTAQMGGELLGPARPMADGSFPLLLKLLDAESILSLQVHPDAAAANQIGRDAVTKTECWYVLESRGGFIYKGVLPGITAQRLALAVDDNTVDRFVRKVPVAAGDFHYL